MISPEWEAQGKPISLLGHPGNPAGYRTMLVHTMGFSGQIGLDASLEEHPRTDADWFPVWLAENNPLATFTGTFDPDIYASNRPYTITKYDIIGKFTYLRAKMVRGTEPPGLLVGEIPYHFGMLYKIEVTK